MIVVLAKKYLNVTQTKQDGIRQSCRCKPHKDNRVDARSLGYLIGCIRRKKKRIPNFMQPLTTHQSR